MKTSANEKKLIPEETLDLAKYLLLLKNNWFKIALFSVLVTALAILVVFSLTPKYQATSILMIEAETTNAVSIEEVVGIDSNKKEYYQTQFEILKSFQVAERVIEQLSLESLAEFNPALSPDKSLMAQIKSLPLFQAYRSEVKVSEEKIRETTRQKALAIFASKLRVSPIRKTQL